MRSKGSFSKIWLTLVVAVLLAFSGCSATGSDAVDPTVSALSTRVSGTATAAQNEASNVNDLATVQVEATAKSASIQATQTAQADTRSVSQLAEATVAAPIIAELTVYGVDSSNGHVGWVHDPLTLEVTKYLEYTYGNDHPEVIAADFVLAADVTWNTQYGSSGCGFMFRSNGDQDAMDQYMILATRFANGHIIFTALVDSEIANVHDFYPATEDASFEWQNDTTNRLAIVARGNLIEIYTNGVKIGEVDTTQPPTRLDLPSKPPAPFDQTDTAAMNAYQSELAEYEDITEKAENLFNTALSNYYKRSGVFDEGFVAMVAASESGKTICTFSDAWLWLIDQ